MGRAGAYAGWSPVVDVRMGAKGEGGKNLLGKSSPRSPAQEGAEPTQHVTWNELGFLLLLPDSKAIHVNLRTANSIEKSLLKRGKIYLTLFPHPLSLALGGREDLKPLLGTH